MRQRRAILLMCFLSVDEAQEQLRNEEQHTAAENDQAQNRGALGDYWRGLRRPRLGRIQLID
jgi:hypothetical protein